ncbi:hypothetical protein KR222_007982 [Zaprionus bogoriensis]|nr:hypothetical protein KR222_007982 [Zaprionus bogoriensis]
MEGAESEIKSFFKNKTVFLTGGSGFLGRVSIEKLLRVTEVRRIYVLIRPKRGKETQDRIAAWSSDSLFQVLLKSIPNALDRVVAIAGDCREPDLGISLKDRQLLAEEVQLVIHGAATVNFLEPLHVALDINTRATRFMLQLAKEMKHLQAFVHISTAFSNCVINHITENFCPGYLNCSVDKVLQLREMLDEKVFDDMAPALMGKFPNTYIYTKALAEQLILTESDQLPVCVFRPAAIIGTSREPVSGWVDNLYGPMAICYGVAFGILRIIYTDRAITSHNVPVDYCASLTLASCWKTAQNTSQRKREAPPIIYNYGIHPKNNFTAGNFVDTMLKHRMLCPLETTLWYPFAICITNVWLYNLAIFFYHLLPGFFIDLILRLSGKKPRLMKVYNMVHKQMYVLRPFATTNFSFDLKNTEGLWKSMSSVDQNLFPFDLELFDWDQYFERASPGMRKYLGKQDPTEESLKRSRKRMKR